MRRRISPVRHRRYWTRPGVVVIVLLAVCYYFLPYDSTLRLSVRFNSQRVVNTFAQPPQSLEAWTLAPLGNATSPSNSLPASGRYLPALYDDVGVILKTGYGTQHRVGAQIEALGLRPHTVDGNNMIVIGDWAGEVVYGDKGEHIFVHDVIAPVLESGILGSRANCARAEKYRALAAAVHAGDDVEAMRISKSDGWELDAMKFIPGLELAYQTMPNKNWYLLLDDDTFVIPSSLRLLLAHLDHSVPHYIGNAVGDFRGRFAHGGSAIVLSREAVTLLLGSGSSRVLAVAAAAAASNRQQGITTNSYKSGLAPPLLHQAYVDSITETWGDKLLATTLMRVGVYLDERFARLFNGARPRATRISADRFCMPLVSFHALAKPEQMRSVGAVFRQIDPGQRGGTPSDATSPGFLAPPIAWGDLWALYGRPTVAALHHQPIHRGRDFVGAPGDDSSSSALVASVTENVGSPEACRVLCAGDDGEGDDAMGADGFQRRFAGLYSYNSKCLAWTWNAGEQTCTTSPWFVVGEDESTGVAPPSTEPASSTTETTSTKYSGVNVALLRQLVGRCGQRDGVSWTERGDKYEFRYNPSGTL